MAANASRIFAQTQAINDSVILSGGKHPATSTDCGGWLGYKCWRLASDVTTRIDQSSWIPPLCQNDKKGHTPNASTLQRLFEVLDRLFDPLVEFNSRLPPQDFFCAGD